jgi:hypothetical protein
MLSLYFVFLFELCEVKGFAPKLMLFAECMSCTIRRRLDLRISIITTLAIITSLIGGTLLFMCLPTRPSGIAIGRRSSFMLKWTLSNERILSI